MVVYHDPQVIVAEGEVVITGKELTILATRARYHLKSQRLYLWGPVKILTAHGDWLKGRWAFMDLRSGEGRIEEAHLFLRKDRVQVKARYLEQTGERKYIAYEATISTCELQCERSPPWSFKARRVEISKGWAKGQGVSFWVKRLPLVYSPWVTLPVKRKRKSGVLWPRLASGSRTGLGLEVPIFLAWHDSFDTTFYPFYTGKRGLMLGLETRFRLSSRTQGILRYRYLYDREKDSDYNADGIRRTNKSRYWLTAKWDQALGKRTALHLDLDLLSDPDFLEEFEGGELGFSQSHESYLKWFGRGLEEKHQTYRTSRLWLEHRASNAYLELASTYYDAQAPWDQKDLAYPWGRLLWFELLRPLWGPLYLEAPFEASYWYQEKGPQGWRLDGPLALVLNLPWGPFENAFTYRWRYTAYLLKEGPDSHQDRSLSEIRWYTSWEMYRLYHPGWGLEGIRHTLRPYLTYFYRSKEDQEELPSWSPEDRLAPEKYWEYGLIQYFTAKKQNGPKVQYWDLLRFKLAQRYDLKKASQKWHPLLGDLEIRTLGRFYLRYEFLYHFYGQGLSRQELTFQIERWVLDHLSLSYQRDRARAVKQFNLRWRQKWAQRYLWHGKVSRNLARSENSYFEMGLTYLGSCFHLDFTWGQTPEETRFSFWINLLGLGGYGRPP